MTKVHGLGATLTAIGLVGSLAACSTTGGQHAMTGKLLFGSKVDTGNIGLATRAQFALKQNDIAGAIDLAERAVANSPKDAGFRALLGNCYLAAGRFASADQAYSDSLALVGAQPQVILKLALTRIATGRSTDALALLQDAQGYLDPSDVGLALALAGNSDAAVQLLESSARAPGADARVRQNLAFAYALGGNWDAARTVAAQDLPADQVEARVQQWLAFAKPSRADAKVSAFIGITPAASDPGQPVRLALDSNAAQTRLAAAQPVPAPAPVAVVVAAPTPVAAVVAAPAPTPVAAVVARAPAPAPVAEPPFVTASVEPVALPAPQPAPQPAVAPASALIKPAVAIAAQKAKPAVKLAAAKPVSFATPRPALTLAAARLTQSLPEIRKAALQVRGHSGAVVQLGAYSSRARIAAAWNHVSGRFGQLRSFQPMTASFAAPQGMVYRLSVRGFANQGQAIAVCASVKRSGGNCFVRAASNDTPVELASR